MAACNKGQHPIPKWQRGPFFIINTPILQAIEHLFKLNIPLIDGPVSRTGATGPIISAYFHDPDGNLIEVSNYANM